MEKYVFREYSSEYTSFYELEKEFIKSRLGNAVKIEHVGSTAVPGMGGKGIVDILMFVKTGSFILYKGMIEELGFEFRETTSTKERLFFRKDYYSETIERRVHLHVVEEGSEEGKKMIKFRDYLRNNSNKVKEYEFLKREAVNIAVGDSELYIKYKQEFIDKINNLV